MPANFPFRSRLQAARHVEWHHSSMPASFCQVTSLPLRFFHACPQELVPWIHILHLSLSWTSSWKAARVQLRMEWLDLGSSGHHGSIWIALTKWSVIALDSTFRLPWLTSKSHRLKASAVQVHVCVMCEDVCSVELICSKPTGKHRHSWCIATGDLYLGTSLARPNICASASKFRNLVSVRSYSPE